MTKVKDRQINNQDSHLKIIEHKFKMTLKNKEKKLIGS